MRRAGRYENLGRIGRLTRFAIALEMCRALMLASCILRPVAHLHRLGTPCGSTTTTPEALQAHCACNSPQRAGSIAISFFGPKIDDGDVFQPPSLRRSAGVIVKQPDAAQRSLENLPIQEFRLAVAVHLQAETHLRIVGIRRNVLAVFRDARRSNPPAPCSRNGQQRVRRSPATAAQSLACRQSRKELHCRRRAPPARRFRSKPRCWREAAADSAGAEWRHRRLAQGSRRPCSPSWSAPLTRDYPPRAKPWRFPRASRSVRPRPAPRPRRALSLCPNRRRLSRACSMRCRLRTCRDRRLPCPCRTRLPSCSRSTASV